jgi:SOS-response transcriptional repressor LexA
MAGGDALQRLREALEKSLPPAPFVGAGLSMAVTGGAAQASWVGLLKDGIRECERVATPLPQGWAGSLSDQLEHPDMVNCITVADQIVRRLRAVGAGRGFSSWIQGTIGNLRATPEGEQIIHTVRRLANDKIIVTTNYDTLIEDPEPTWHSYTWTDDEYAATQRLDKAVIHLHGLPRDPRSIILGSADYERLQGEELNRIFGQSLFMAFSFVFIGCGIGLRDPHIGLLVEFLHRAFPQERAEDRQYKRPPESYILVRGSELRQFNENPPAPFIAAVAYGVTFDEFGPFLRKLAAGDDPKVSQDPEFYDHVGAKSQRGLLDLAGPAQQKLRRVQDALERALHAMGQVEHRSAMPLGMGTWDYEDQRAVHEQLAASVTSPAESLLSCSIQIIPLFTDAGTDVGRLTAPAFAAYSTDLARLINMVSELADKTKLLLDRTDTACDDLHGRVGRCSDYLTPYDSLLSARSFIEQANDSAVSLKDGLNRLRNVQVDDEAQPIRLTPRTTNLQGTQPEAERALQVEVQQIPVLGKVAAGEPILTTRDVEFLEVPPRYANRGNAFALKVQGDSMTGDAILDGDFIIVVPEPNPHNGDMVVVTFPSEDGGEGSSTVKRWRPRPDGRSVALESTVSDVDPIILSEDAWPAYVQGKVIGVERWQIR